MQLLTLLSAAAAAGVASAQTANAGIPAGVVIEPRLETQALKDGGIRKTIKYGPYALPAGGMISKPSLGAESPCSNCYITAIQAKISYTDGKEANIDSGAWLHHMVVTKMGGTGVGPIFASGNERTPLRINNHYKYGIEMGTTDRFMFLTDLMSNAKDNKNLQMELTYEYIPKAAATGYKAAYMRWNDVGEPSAKTGVYKFETRPWSSPVAGKLLYTNGHVHDGGTHTSLFINNKEVCRSTMLYNRRPGFSESGDAHAGMDMGAPAASPAASPAAGASGMEGMDMGDAEHSHGRRDGGAFHISDSSTCQNFGTIARGDKMHIEAWYDSNKYPLMEHNGKKERLMGIMRVYIGQ